MADNYPDLTALAANDPSRHGRLWYCRDGNCWTYAGCPTPPAANLKVPAASVPDARVQAALADGSWIGSVVDTAASPIRLLAVQVAPSPGTAFQPIRASDLGTAAAA